LAHHDKERLDKNQGLGLTFSGKVKWAGAEATTVKVGDIVYGYTNDAAGALHDWVRVPVT